MPTIALIALFVIVQAQSAPPSTVELVVAEPFAFARYLGERRIPAGLEIRRTEHNEFKPVHVDQEWARRQPEFPVDQLIQMFNAKNTGYEATLQQGVVLIRPTRGRSEYLDSRPLSGTISSTGLRAFANRVFQPLDPPNRPGGRPGSSLSTPGVTIDKGERLHIVVSGTERLTVIETLNEAAKQAPGHPWVVETGDNARPVRYGFIHERMTVSWSSVP